MKFGIMLPNGSPFDIPMLLEAGQLAEQLGFDSLLLTDHLANPLGKASFESWTLLGSLAARTTRIRLGTCVTPISLRPPAILANVVSTLDNLTGGRVILGVGAGWFQKEFEGYGSWYDSASRIERTGEGIELIIKLWTEGTVDFNGKYYSVKGAVLEPKPVQKPHPQLWFGSMSDRMLKLTAKYGTGWIAGGLTVHRATTSKFKECSEKLQEYAKQYGRKDKLTNALLAAVIPDELDESSVALPHILTSLGHVSSCSRKIEEFRSVGCDYLLLSLQPLSRHWVNTVKQFSKDVISSFT